MRIVRGFGARAALAALAATALAASPNLSDSAPDDGAAFAPPTEHTMILLDATADMAVGATAPRFDLQRHALAAVPMPPGDVSIAAYGGEHCGGFTAIGARPGVSGGLRGVAPKGRRNLTAALRAAASAFPEDARRKRILAIAGGANQCLAALCAFASQLKARQPDITVDLIGYGLSDAEAQRLACLPANTGGRFSRADESGLATALTLSLGPTSTMLAGLEATSEVDAPGLANTPEPTNATLAEALHGPELSFPRGLRLSAALGTPEGPLANARFELFKTDATGVRRLVARTERTATPLFAVPPGTYVARAAYGPVSQEATVTVPTDGVATERLLLEAGKLEIAALVGGRAPSQGVTLRIQNLTDTEAAPITFRGRGQALTPLPAGRHRVTATVGAATANLDVEIRAGEAQRIAIPVASGYLRVNAPGPATIFAGGRKVMDVWPEDAAAVRLPPGAYRIVSEAYEATAVVEDGRMAAADLGEGAGDRTIVKAPEDRDRVLIAQQPQASAGLNR